MSRQWRSDCKEQGQGEPERGPNDFNCFNWVIDAHPEDISKIDYIRPDGIPVMRTVADYRQHNDALFHAGLDPGSMAEWIDAPNRLNYYIIDLEKNPDCIIVYEVGVRSLYGIPAGENTITILPPAIRKLSSRTVYLPYTLKYNDCQQIQKGIQIFSAFRQQLTERVGKPCLPIHLFPLSMGETKK